MAPRRLYTADGVLPPQALAKKSPRYCRLSTAGEAKAAKEKAQLKPSAQRPIVPAAALETLMQATRRAAAMISIASLSIATFMARTSPRSV